MNNTNFTNKIRLMIAKKMKNGPVASDEEQAVYNRKMEESRKRHSHRYSDDMVHPKSPGQRYREMSHEQKERAERKSEELRKQFPEEEWRTKKKFSDGKTFFPKGSY